jgi:DNA-binding Lrp family transcriptional regulator
MSVQAYVFVECAPGKPTQVTEALAKIPGVEMAHAVTGSYDVIAFVRVASVEVLGDLLSRQIHRLPGVLKTTTNVVVQGTGGGDPKETDRRQRA